MSNIKSRQTGFGVVGIVAVVLVVLVIAGVGFVVFKKSGDSKTATTPAASSPTTTTPSNAAGTKEPKQVETPVENLFKVPELGVQFTIPDSLKDLEYQPRDVELSDGSKIKGVYFSTKSLTKAAAKCGADEWSIAAMAIAQGQYPEKGNELRRDYGPLLKQFPDKFVTFQTSRTSCVDTKDEKLLKQQSDTVQALQDSVKTVQLVD